MFATTTKIPTTCNQPATFWPLAQVGHQQTEFHGERERKSPSLKEQPQLYFKLYLTFSSYLFPEREIKIFSCLLTFCYRIFEVFLTRKLFADFHLKLFNVFFSWLVFKWPHFTFGVVFGWKKSRLGVWKSFVIKNSNFISHNQILYNFFFSCLLHKQHFKDILNRCSKMFIFLLLLLF